MIVAPRSEDCPYCSRRALASSSFKRSISNRAPVTSRLGRQPCGTLGEDHRVRRGKIGRQRAVFRHHVAT